MVEETLVGIDVELGSQILNLLDAAKFPVPVALCIRSGDEERLRQELATPLLRYTWHSGSLPEVSPHDMAERPGLGELAAPTSKHPNPLVRELRRISRKAASVAGMCLGGQMIGGVWVDEAYVYRIQ